MRRWQGITSTCRLRTTRVQRQVREERAKCEEEERTVDEGTGRASVLAVAVVEVLALDAGRSGRRGSAGLGEPSAGLAGEGCEGRRKMSGELELDRKTRERTGFVKIVAVSTDVRLATVAGEGVGLASPARAVSVVVGC